jgi:hypothetical protein
MHCSVRYWYGTVHANVWNRHSFSGIFALIPNGNSYSAPLIYRKKFVVSNYQNGFGSKFILGQFIIHLYSLICLLESCKAKSALLFNIIDCCSVPVPLHMRLISGNSIGTYEGVIS